MHSKIFLGAAAFSAVAVADISIDVNQANRVASDFLSYISSVTANPAFQSDVSALASAIPASVIAAAQQDPEAFGESLITATALPPWITAIPTNAIDSLESLAAKPIKAAEDVESYVVSIITGPAGASIDSIFATAIPSSVVAALESDPVSFIEAQITGTAGVPDYITALPSAVEASIGNFINAGLSIIASDLEASSTPRVSIPTLKPSNSRVSYKATGTGGAKATGTGGAKASGTGVYYTGGARSSTLSFTGAASSVVVNTIGAGVLATFGIVLALL